MFPRNKEIPVLKIRHFFFKARALKKGSTESPGFLFAVHKADSLLLHILVCEVVAFAQLHLFPIHHCDQPAVGGSAVDMEQELSCVTIQITHTQ